jgi:hypothetical protein
MELYGITLAAEYLYVERLSARYLDVKRNFADTPLVSGARNRGERDHVDDFLEGITAGLPATSTGQWRESSIASKPSTPASTASTGRRSTSSPDSRRLVCAHGLALVG